MCSFETTKELQSQAVIISFGTNFQKYAISSEEFCSFEKIFFAQNDLAVQWVPTEYWQDN